MAATRKKSKTTKSKAKAAKARKPTKKAAARTKRGAARTVTKPAALAAPYTVPTPVVDVVVEPAVAPPSKTRKRKPTPSPWSKELWGDDA